MPPFDSVQTLLAGPETETETELLARATELQASWGTNVAIAFVLLAALSVGLALLAWYLRIRIGMERERLHKELEAHDAERCLERTQRTQMFEAVLEGWKHLAGDGNGNKGMLEQWQADIRAELQRGHARFSQIEQDVTEIRITLMDHLQVAHSGATAPKWLLGDQERRADATPPHTETPTPKS